MKRAIALLLLLVPPAMAERPFRTDDPYQERLYGWEVFGGIELDQGSYGGIRDRSEIKLNAGFEYGITEKSEIGLSADFFRLNDPGDDGLGDALLHYKHRMTEANPSVPDIALDLELKIPTASKADNLGTGKADLALDLLLGWKNAKWTNTFSIGYVYTVDQNLGNHYRYGIATRYLASEDVKFMGELVLDSRNREVSLGGARRMGPGFWMDLMFGVGLKETVPDLSIRVGATSTL